MPNSVGWAIKFYEVDVVRLVLKSVTLMCLLASMVFVQGCFLKNMKDSDKENLDGQDGSSSKKLFTKKDKATKRVVVAKPLPPENCKVFPKADGQGPFYLEDSDIVVTQIVKPCVTRDGNRGFEKNSPWMAMGFPCTGGGGKISTIGHYNNPKVVSFIISTGCPMVPSNLSMVRQAAQDNLGVDEGMKLLSFNSFVVQFWEVPGLPDADTGFTVEISSPAGRGSQWKSLRKKEPMRVWLYGRENSWSSRDQFFKVDAEITLGGARDFSLQVFEAKELQPDEISLVKQRCEALRPRRSCSQVF